MNYQKVYMNQIYTSSLVGQVAHMWRNQLLCDAVIKTGNINTKAHRLVLIAACPMLQHMENASVGSHLEVRLSSDIKQSSVTTFLQYLYEGFMMLTEENCKDVEKIGKLLHVDSVVKCCIDFYKCLSSKTGAPITEGNKFDNQDQLEFRYVRATELQKTQQDSALKRSSSDNVRPASPQSKRQRVQRASSPIENSYSVLTPNSGTNMITGSSLSSPVRGCPSPIQSSVSDMFSIAQSYRPSKTLSKRVQRAGHGFAGSQGKSSTDSIEIMEEGVEVVNIDPRERDSQGWPKPSDLPPIQRSMGIAVSSQQSDETNVQVLDVESNSSGQSTESQRTKTSKQSSNIHNKAESSPKIPVHVSGSQDVDSYSTPRQSEPSTGMIVAGSTDSPEHLVDVDSSMRNESSISESVGGPLQLLRGQQVLTGRYGPALTGRPFAAGSASQFSMINIAASQNSVKIESARKESAVDKDQGLHNLASDQVTSDSGLSGSKTPPDLSIVKVEPDLDTDVPLEMQAHSFSDSQDLGQDLNREDMEDQREEWEREDYSNEGSNISGDQSGNWQEGAYIGLLERDASGLDPSVQINQCKKCGEIFSDGYALVQHLREVEKRKFCEMCKLCGEVFFLNRTYRYHLQVKHNLSTNCPRCEICGSYFQDNYNLKRHIAIHSSEKLFACSKCDSKFRQKHSMKSHEKLCKGKNS